MALKSQTSREYRWCHIHLSHDRKPCCRRLTAGLCFFFCFHVSNEKNCFILLPSARSFQGHPSFGSQLRPLFHWEVTRLAARPCASPYPSSLGLTSLAPSCFSDVLPSNSARTTQRQNDTNQYTYVHNYILYNIPFFNFTFDEVFMLCLLNNELITF